MQNICTVSTYQSQSFNTRSTISIFVFPFDDFFDNLIIL